MPHFFDYFNHKNQTGNVEREKITNLFSNS